MCSRSLANSLGLLYVYARFRPFQPETDARHHSVPPWLPIHRFLAASSVLPSELCYPAVRVTDGDRELVLVGFCAFCHSGRGTFSHVLHV